MSFYIMHLNIDIFHKEILRIFNDEINYNFKPNSVYYLHLLDPYGHVLVAIPFILQSKNDNEDRIEDLYIKLFPFLQKFLAKYEKYNPDYFIIYIDSNINEYITYKDQVFYKKKKGNLYYNTIGKLYLQFSKKTYLEEICLFCLFIILFLI